MSASPITRFLAPMRALIGLLLLMLAAGWLALMVAHAHFGNEISIRAILLDVALLGGAVVAFASAYPTGCRGCRKRFEEIGGAFPWSLYEPMLEALQGKDVATLGSLAEAPDGSAQARTTLIVRHCPSCRRVGEAVISEERGEGASLETGREQILPLDAEVVAALLKMIAQRL